MNPLKVTILQTALIWESIEANLQQLSKKIATISAVTDVVVLPEMFSTGFSMNPSKLAETPKGKTFNWMLQQAKKLDAAIVGSYIVEEKNNYYNRLVLSLIHI